MAGVLDHFEDNLKVWDGKQFSHVPRAQAKKLEKSGTHQIATGITAAELKRPEEFKPKPKTSRKAKTEDVQLPGVNKTYKTREMKAQK